MLLPQAVRQRFDYPKYVGSLPITENVRMYDSYGIGASDVVRLYLQISKTGVIEKATYKVIGCPFLIASLEYGIETILNKHYTEALSILYQDIVDALSIPDAKIYCAIQTEEVIKKAITEYTKHSIPQMYKGETRHGEYASFE